MKSVFFCILIGFYICQADLTLEKDEKDKKNIHYNKPNLMTQDLLDLEYSAIKQIESITYPLLDEIRLAATVANKIGKNPSNCIHESTKFLLSSVNEFYIELDHCNMNENMTNDIRDASACNEKLISAFRSIANGAQEFFKSCIDNISNISS